MYTEDFEPNAEGHRTQNTFNKVRIREVTLHFYKPIKPELDIYIVVCN
jgi:hypothetical protein